MSLSLCYVQLPRASALMEAAHPARARTRYRPRPRRTPRAPIRKPPSILVKIHTTTTRRVLRFRQFLLSTRLMVPRRVLSCAHRKRHAHSFDCPAGHFRRRRPFSSPPSFARDVSGCFTCLSSSSRGSHPRASRRGRARRVRRADTRTRPTCPFACADAGMPR